MKQLRNTVCVTDVNSFRATVSLETLLFYSKSQRVYMGQVLVGLHMVK